MTNSRLASSFRDPDGFIFRKEGKLFRRVSEVGLPDYNTVKASGLYEALWEKEYLVRHTENHVDERYVDLQPEELTFISYPYEWCFEQLKDAALLTLKVQNLALKFGMSLKDASAYNVQFVGTKPIFIDTLSFEPYQEGKPWVGYKQFCQHFLAPLTMATYHGVDWLKSLRVHIDGFPLNMVSQALPSRSKLNSGLLFHLHWHAKSQVKHADTTENPKGNKSLDKKALTNLLKNLYSTVKKLDTKDGSTEWGDYYNNTNYSESSFQNKLKLVGDYIEEVAPTVVWDMGANDGTFSRLASDKGIPTIAWDIDPIAVGLNYKKGKASKDRKMLPLIQDLTNPSAGIGWAHLERDSLEGRSKKTKSLVMALALIHHISISNNVPLEMVAEYFSKLGEHLIIEFVPKGDSKVDKLLATRKDIFPAYTEKGFESAFSTYFELKKKSVVQGSKRTLYLYKRK
jgi:ribosomal protein L11 methylase PrmA